MDRIVEWRGIEGAVYAEVLEDSKENFTTGEVKDLAPTSELSKETATNSAAHYYDNVPAVVIESTGADTVKVSCAAFEQDVIAEVTGQYYDPDTGMLVEGERESKYFAFGYRTKKTDGTEVLVWRLKGTFGIPASTHHTEDDGTDANGQEITYTGVNTTHKFTKTGRTAKAVNVDMSKKLVDASEFFDKVQTPDTITPISAGA